MIYNSPITEVIKNRFSCRSYLEEPIAPKQQGLLRDYMKNLTVGPFGAPVRFDLITAEDQDRKALRGLGTYGFIKGGSGFVVGAARPDGKNLEDYGYRLEQIVLYATDMGLGTCWLGGTFTRSSFARKINAASEECLPSVLAIGQIADEAQARQTLMRRYVGADQRLAWETLFFDGSFGAPLAREQAGPYGPAFEMVRLGPSASNKQPWRIVRAGNAFHFFLQRTEGYRNSFTKLAGIEDIQRVDMGIAMSHFELSAVEAGLSGSWANDEPDIHKPSPLLEYIATWVEK